MRYRKGDRVQITTSHWAGKNQCGRIVNTRPRYRPDGYIVLLDDVEKRPCRIYSHRSLRRLSALERLGEVAG
jgi:hypothetical protein